MSKPILCVRRSAFLPLPTGFHPMSESAIIQNLDAARLWLGPRTDLEVDDSFRQLIPYVVLRLNGKILCYQRSSAGSESRLHGQWSVGLGGHVELRDVSFKRDSTIRLAETLDNCAAREVMEEVGAISLISKRWAGFLVDDDAPVGRVHLGVVAIWEVSEGIASPHDPEIASICFAPHSELGLYRLERWSALLVDFLDV